MIFKFIQTLFFLFLLVFLNNYAFAAPLDGNVVHGNIEISGGGANTQINQYTDKAIINWGSFDIGKGELVNFNQPGSSSVVLNRVTGGTPSEISGKLTGNGNVFLINPNGLLIGNGASIETGGFLGSTANINDRDFINGRYIFSNASGHVKNSGNIKVNSGGFVALLGKNVSNDGVISAGLGKVFMASGESFRLNFDQTGLIGLDVDKGIIGGETSNSGLIEGASVIMTARDASDILIGVVNNSGVIRASGITSEGGKIVLSGGSVIQSGTIDASGVSGGFITINGGNSVKVESGSIISANGQNKGGEIKIVSKGTTEFNKGAKAEATSVYGNGGFIEVSGVNVKVEGIADTRSIYGAKGNFLIDPTDMIIMKNAPTDLPSNGSVSYIDMDYLNGQLALSDVTIATVGTEGGGKGDITVAGGAGSVITGGGLTLDSANDIIIANESMNLTSGLTLKAGGSITSSALLNLGSLNMTALGSLISVSNIGLVGQINADGKSGKVSLGGLGDLNISSLSGEQVFLEAAGVLNGQNISGQTLNMVSGGNMNVNISASQITAQSNTGTINIENTNTGDVVIDMLKTANQAINYKQVSGGKLTLSDSLNSGTAQMTITNEIGQIYAGFDFVKNPLNLLFLKSKEVYLTKADENAALMDSLLMSKIDAGLLDVKAVGDIIISDDITRGGMSLNLTSADGAVTTGVNRIIVSELNITAQNDINIISDIEKGTLISTSGNINVSEKNGVDFKLISAENGETSVTIENAGNLNINDVVSKDGVYIATADGSEVTIKGKDPLLVIDFANGIDNKIKVENGGGITIRSWNMPGIIDLFLASSSGGIILPTDSLDINGSVVLKGTSLNEGNALSISAKDLLLNIKNGGVITLSADKADISGGNFQLTLLKNIVFEDLNNDKLAINTGNFNVKSDYDVSVANKASATSFNIKSNNFKLSSFNSSLVGDSIVIDAVGDITGTGRIAAKTLFMRGSKIGENSALLINAPIAQFYASWPSGGNTISIIVPDRFTVIKNYSFSTNGNALINGLSVDKRIYALLAEASLRNFTPIENTNIGREHGFYPVINNGITPNDLVTVDIPVAKGISSILRKNDKIELK